MTTPRDRAIQLLGHYIRTAFQHSGVKWTADNDAEITDLIDAILDAADDAAQAHADRVQDQLDTPDWRQRRLRAAARALHARTDGTEDQP